MKRSELKKLISEYIEELSLKKGEWDNITPHVKSDPVAKDIIDLIKTAYKDSSLGSFITSKSDLKNKNWLAIDYDDEPDIDATIFYREPRGNETWVGKKIQGIGHDGTLKSIEYVINKLKELLNKSGYWIEASEKLEKILYRIGVPYVDDEDLANKIFPNTNLKMIGKKGKYVRVESGKKIEETIFGKPKVK